MIAVNEKFSFTAFFMANTMLREYVKVQDFITLWKKVPKYTQKIVKIVKKKRNFWYN